MPISRIMARINRAATNRVTGLFAGRIPGFAVVQHRGRRSGRSYGTPINVFRVPDGYVVALPYGPDADWVRNVVAANGCVLRTRGRRIPLTEPRVVRDLDRPDVPAAARRVLGLLGVNDFLYLKTGAERVEPR